MTTFSMTVNELVREAYEAAALLEEDEDLSAAKLNRGVSILNQLVSQFNTGEIVPYYQNMSFNLVGGQSEYVLSLAEDADVETNPLIQLSNALITVTGQTFALEIITDQEYFNTWQNTATIAQPWQVYLDSGINTSTLTFYPTPDQAYSCQIRGKFTISNFVANTDITNLPSYYYQYLIFLLAKRLAVSYPSGVWTQLAQDFLDDAENAVRSANKLNVQVNNSPALIGNGGFYNNILGGVWP